VIQPRAGYRFSVDSILLARFAVGYANGARVLELGAGSGVISMTVAALARPREMAAVEIQPELAAMCRRSAELNRLDSLRVLEADLRAPDAAMLAPASFDLVLANPPYRARAAGRESPHRGRRLARSEEAASLADFVAAAARYARPRGDVAMVFLADRVAELISRLRENQLEPKRIRFVHPFANARAASVLAAARKGGGIEAAVEPPLIMYERPGVYSAEARALLDLP
jgi:tRNA1Val (adenine37-N6)-methyltransferase